MHYYQVFRTYHYDDGSSGDIISIKIFQTETEAINFVKNENLFSKYHHFYKIKQFDTFNEVS